MEGWPQSWQAGLILVQISICSHVNMKINWSQTIVAYFCKLEIKDLRKLKWIQHFYFWGKLNEIWHIKSLISKFLCNCFHSEFVRSFWNEGLKKLLWKIDLAVILLLNIYFSSKFCNRVLFINTLSVYPKIWGSLGVFTLLLNQQQCWQGCNAIFCSPPFTY